MTFTPEPPEREGWYWVRDGYGGYWNDPRPAHRDEFGVFWTDGGRLSVIVGPNQEVEYGPLIPSPEKLAAMEKCCEELRVLVEASTAYMEYHTEKFYSTGSSPPIGTSRHTGTAQAALDALEAAE